MVKRKGNRKKGLLRKADTQEIEEEIARQQHEAQRGVAVRQMPDEQLFFEDKAGDEKEVVQGLQHRRRAQRIPKPLRCEVITQPKGGPGVPRQKGRHKLKTRQLQQVVAPEQGDRAAGQGLKRKQPKVYDIWGGGPILEEAPLRQAHDPISHPHSMKRQKVSTRSPVQPVEVPLPGCSYNPDPEQHQDALAAAVAAELRKEAQQEASKALPQRRLEAPADPLAQLLDEGVAFEDEQTSDEEEGSQPGQPTTRGAVAERRTRSDRNRQLRRIAAEREAAARREQKRHRRDLQNLDQIKAAVLQREADLEALRLRREADKAEKALDQPPRLGKLKFTADAVQVLLTEEADGSLRKLKATPANLLERYKSLQKRGIVEPRKPVRLRHRRHGKILA